MRHLVDCNMHSFRGWRPLPLPASRKYLRWVRGGQVGFEEVGIFLLSTVCKRGYQVISSAVHSDWVPTPRRARAAWQCYHEWAQTACCVELGGLQSRTSQLTHVKSGWFHEEEKGHHVAVWWTPREDVVQSSQEKLREYEGKECPRRGRSKHRVLGRAWGSSSLMEMRSQQACLCGQEAWNKARCCKVKLDRLGCREFWFLS